MEPKNDGFERQLAAQLVQKGFHVLFEVLRAEAPQKHEPIEDVDRVVRQNALAVVFVLEREELLNEPQVAPLLLANAPDALDQDPVGLFVVLRLARAARRASHLREVLRVVSEALEVDWVLVGVLGQPGYLM